MTPREELQQIIDNLCDEEVEAALRLLSDLRAFNDTDNKDVAYLERLVDAAPNNPRCARLLLAKAAIYFEADRRLPPTLARYLAAAFRRIIKNRNPRYTRPIRTTKEYEEYVRVVIDSTGTDANEALNLKWTRAGSQQPEQRALVDMHRAFVYLSQYSREVREREVDDPPRSLWGAKTKALKESEDLLGCERSTIKRALARVDFRRLL